MKKNIVIVLITIFLLNYFGLGAQNFEDLKIKEEFDLFNADLTIRDPPCSPGASNLGGYYGDGLCFTLEGYITMYKTTRDKAYLYKFMLEALCVIKNRGSNYRWGGEIYQDGYIIGAMARFVFLIKKEESSLGPQTCYNFQEFADPPFNNANPTFLQFANWLAAKVGQTMDSYILDGTFDYNLGVLRNIPKKDPYEMNWHVGFGRAALFNGQTDPNTSEYIPRADNIASYIKGSISIIDPCYPMEYDEPMTYNEKVLRYNSAKDSYWWYHTGWRVPTHDCFAWVPNPLLIPPFIYVYIPKVVDYEKYIEFKEDTKHGVADLMMFKDFHDFQTTNYITLTDMIRFRNMFSRNIFDGNTTNIGFYNAVDGTDSPIYQGIQAHSTYSLASMCYMPLEVYDAYVSPQHTYNNVYDIIMNFYKNRLAGLPTIPSPSGGQFYGGLADKGHADVVAAQWRHECVNLELYNRNVVYNQDFFAKNKLIVTPSTPHLQGGASYAAPVIYTPEFIVPSNVIVNMTAGESITLKAGVQIKAGSTFNASVISNHVCSDGMRLASDNTGGGKNQPPDQPIIETDIENAKQIKSTVIKLKAVPNPFTNSTSIQFSLEKESKVNLKLMDAFGRVVYDSKEDVNGNAGFNEIVVATDNFGQGLYSCVLKINNEEIQTINIIKQ